MLNYAAGHNIKLALHVVAFSLRNESKCENCQRQKAHLPKEGLFYSIKKAFLKLCRYELLLCPAVRLGIQWLKLLQLLEATLE